MFNNLGICSGLGLPGSLPTFIRQAPVSRKTVGRAPVSRAPVADAVVNFGGYGNDIINIGGSGVGPPGPPGPPGPQGPPGTLGLAPVTDVVASTYTALSTDYFLCVLTSGLVTITLPTGILGTIYIVKDCFGNGTNNPITVQGTGGQLIDGSPTAIINVNYGSIQFVFNGTDWSIV